MPDDGKHKYRLRPPKPHEMGFSPVTAGQMHKGNATPDVHEGKKFVVSPPGKGLGRKVPKHFRRVGKR